MKKELTLKFPSLEDKEQWLEYYKEFQDDDLNSDPLNYSKYKNYEDFLIGIGKEECLIRSTKKSIPTSSYLLVKDDEIIGHIFIHHFIDLNLQKSYEGHIGYAIRPNKRKQGYGTKILNLALEKCKELNLHEILISCDKENIASEKIIERNNGELLEELYVPEENAIIKKYLIRLSMDYQK